MFRHHPDGRIHIDDAVLPLSEFMIDEPGYFLPPGMIGRFYDGTMHKVYNKNKERPGKFPWPEGDVFISKKQEYLDNMAARNPPPPPPPPQTDEEFIDAVYPQSGRVAVRFRILFKMYSMILANETPPTSITEAEFRDILLGELP